jgi:proteasome lid subunit RPN8/RPN11
VAAQFCIPISLVGVYHSHPNAVTWDLCLHGLQA